MTERLLEEVLFDILNAFNWETKTNRLDNIKKELEKYVKTVVYRTLALWTQGKTSNYVPVAESLVILGKEETLKRLKKATEYCPTCGTKTKK